MSVRSVDLIVGREVGSRDWTKVESEVNVDDAVVDLSEKDLGFTPNAPVNKTFSVDSAGFAIDPVEGVRNRFITLVIVLIFGALVAD